MNQFGIIAKVEWQKLKTRFPRVDLDEYIVMPNHVHGIIVILEGESAGDSLDDSVGARQKESRASLESYLASPLLDTPSPLHGMPSKIPHGAPTSSLGAIVGAYKSTLPRLVNAFRRTPGALLWQRNYYKHVIRNDEDLARIRRYIRENPALWATDRENPAGVKSPKRIPPC